MKRLLTILLSLLLANVAAHANDDDENAANATAQVETAVVAERSLAETLPAYGSVKTGPRQLQDVVAAHAGEVSEILVLPGQKVRAGETLLKLAAAPENAAAYAQAKSADDFARSSLQRTQTLFAERLATREQLADAERAAGDADANLKAQRALGGDQAVSELQAPADGVVAAIPVHKGERVAENALLLSFEGGGDSYAELGVNPEDSQQLHAGMAVRLTPVFGGTTLDAKLTQVGGRVDDASGLVELSVRLPAAARLLPGAAVQGAIVLRAVQSLAVPRGAVLQGDDGAYVFVVRDKTAHRVTVQIGIEDGDWTGVSGNLKTGDRVVTLGNYELSDGMAVRGAAP